jgi:hypothetical protein
MRKICETMASTRLFAGLDHSVYHEHCINTPIHTFWKGQLIVMEGDLCKGIGIVVEGRIARQKYTPSGEFTTLELLGEGSVFGEDLIFSTHKQYSYSLEALTHVKTVMVEIRSAYLLHRLTWSDKAPSGYDILKIATKGSAAILGRDDIGSLEVGKAADLFAIDTSSLEFVCAENDVANLLGTVGVSKPARFVYVNGVLVSHDGILIGIDEENVAYEARRRVNGMLRKAGM